MAKKVTKDMIIADLLKVDANMAAILMNAGMFCLYCPSAQAETLGEAAFVHGINADELVDQINDYLAQ